MGPPPQEVRRAPSRTPELERELLDHCRARLAGFTCRTRIDATDELPRTPTGKLLKHALRRRSTTPA